MKLENARMLGLQVIVQPDTHRTLPPEVCPGVTWPPGFKAEIDAWMRGFFRPHNMIRDGEMWHDRMHDVIHMNPRTWAKVKASFADAINPTNLKP